MNTAFKNFLQGIMILGFVGSEAHVTWGDLSNLANAALKDIKDQEDKLGDAVNESLN